MEKILIIEDDRAVQRALKRLFESEGYGVEIKGDGKSALDSFRAAAPAAIVLDLRLPTLSGKDVCREIKRESPELPIVVLSATTDVTDKVLLLELGADDYVTKPFSSKELLARVRATIRRTRKQQLAELVSKPLEGVTQVQPDGDTWTVGVEVVEDRRVPSSADVLALYEIDIDKSGDVLSYRRLRRYARGRGDEGGS